MQYSIFAQPLKIDYSVSPIKPAKMAGEPLINYMQITLELALAQEFHLMENFL